jgi:hypothetical protein
MVTLDVLDSEDPNPSIQLVSIQASEPGQEGDVIQPGDVEEAEFGTDDRNFFLRARNNGRTRQYVITYEIDDAMGNMAFAEATVDIQ